MSNDASSVPATAASPAVTSLLPPDRRLEASRLALRAAMTPPPPVVKPAGSSLVDKLRVVPPVNSLLSHPAVATARDTLRQWWTAHPWRPLLAVGVEAGKQAIVPLARRHPARLIGAAMVGGALLSRWRPWKWLIVSAAPAVAASLLPTLLSRAATRIPLSALLKIVGASSSARARAPNASSSPVVVPTARVPDKP